MWIRAKKAATQSVETAIDWSPGQNLLTGVGDMGGGTGGGGGGVGTGDGGPVKRKLFSV